MEQYIPTRKFGWIDPENHSAIGSWERSIVKDNLPVSFQLDIGSEVFDQGSLGSCTSNAIISAYAYIKKKVNFHTVDYTCTTIKENQLKL